MDNKRRLCRLIERFVNDFQGEAVESIYGKGSTIKIHTADFGVTVAVGATKFEVAADTPGLRPTWETLNRPLR